MIAKCSTQDRIKAFLKNMATKVMREISQPKRNFKPDFEIVASFVHAYEDDVKILGNALMPALWHIKNAESSVHSYPFPRNAEEFYSLSVAIKGEMPKKDAGQLEKLPRFGLTGLTADSIYIYAASWNAIYKISKSDFTLKEIISNHLMCDMHGICCDENFLYSGLTCKDTLVISDYEGNVVDKISIRKDLTVFSDIALDNHDWRFISKKHRGSVGHFHFNHIQKFGDEIYLTSRSLNNFVVLNLKTRKCHLRVMNTKSPILIHDGAKVDDKYYFTSIDGKILIAEESGLNNAESLHNSDLIATEINLKRKPNWCRGIAVKGDVILTNVDGRYGSGLTFGIHAVSAAGKYIGEVRLSHKKANFRNKILYITGFDILLP